jgi:hypothetical protein
MSPPERSHRAVTLLMVEGSMRGEPSRNPKRDDVRSWVGSSPLSVGR